ncbi:MAG: Ribosomal protein methyltransferase [Bacillales bacterium]|nr:Ribosomal protein methyltransferase [Bacillales bacterium]
MKWSELSIHTTQEAVEPITNILHEAGASGVVIEDPFDLFKERENVFGEIYQLNPDDYPTEGVIVKAYLPVNSFIGETVDQIKEAINNLILFEIDLGLNEISLSEVNEEEWATAWKKYYHPVQISEKFTVVPTWEEYEIKSPDEKIIELDPGMAFGTGTHPTTVLCIRAIEKVVKPGDEVVDVGTGSGVLSIAAAKLDAKKVFAYDLDEIAVHSATLNIKINKVLDLVEVSQSNLLSSYTGAADVIVANLLAEIVIRLSPDAITKIKPNGKFIVSGIIQTKKIDVINQLEKDGFVIDEVMEMEDWVAIIAHS